MLPSKGIRMCPKKATVIYNQPAAGRYSRLGEDKAELGVMDAQKAVRKALVELGYEVEIVPLSPPLEKVRETIKSLKADVIFNLFEGFMDSPETEPAIAEMLVELKIPFTGCPPSILSLALDKARTKAVLVANGVQTPRYQVLTPDTISAFNLDFPCMVKPGGEDASHGVSENSVVKDVAALARQVKLISEEYGGRALVEEFVDGREFNITVLGTKALDVLPISEIVFLLPPGLPHILTFGAKWEPKSPYFDATKAVCPAAIDAPLRDEIGRIARQTFGLLGGSGYARVDLRVNDKGPQVIEVNPNPDISPGTGAARQAKASGLTYSQFIESLIKLAFQRETP
jgi:D-alanine-D-alanine ligase